MVIKLFSLGFGFLFFLIFLFNPLQPRWIYALFLFDILWWSFLYRKDVLVLFKKVKIKDYLVVVFLTGIALVARLTKLGELPFGFWLDEPDYALAGLSLLKESTIVPFTMKAIDGQMTPLLYLIGLSVKTFGYTAFAVRFPIALIASLNIPVFFLVSRLFARRFAAIIATLFFTFSYWHIVFSRIAFQVPLLILTDLLVIGFLYLALKEEKLGYWVLAGIFLGLSLYTYTPARWFAFIILSGAVYFAFYSKHFLIFLFSFFLSASPLIAYTIRYPSDILFRLNKLSILKASEVHSSIIGELAISTFKNVGMFWLIPDTNGRHNPAQSAALDPITGLLFLGTIVYSIATKRKMPRIFVLFSFLMLLPAILSFEGKGGENQPHMLRVSGSLPFVYLSVAFFLNWLLNQAFFKKKSTLVFVVLIIAVILNLRRYFTTPLTPKLYYEMNVREATVGQLVSQSQTQTIVLSPYFYRVPQVVFLKGEKMVEIFDPTNTENYLNNLSILIILDVSKENKESIEQLTKLKPDNSRFITTSWGTTEVFVYERKYD